MTTTKEALEQLDLTDIAFKLSQMALKVISGKQIEQKTYQISMSIPADLAESLESLSKQVDLPLEDMLSHLATEGFNRSLKTRIEEQQKPEQTPSQDLQDATGIDLSSLEQGLSKLNELAGRLQLIEGALETNGQQTETPKNRPKPNIPLKPIPCNSGGKNE